MKKKNHWQNGSRGIYTTHTRQRLSPYKSLLLWTFPHLLRKKTTQHEIPGFAIQPVVQGTKGVDWQTGISEVERSGDGVEEGGGGGKNRVLGFHKWKVRFERIKRGSALIRRVWNVCMYMMEGLTRAQILRLFLPCCKHCQTTEAPLEKFSSHGLLDIAWFQVRCQKNSDL